MSLSHRDGLCAPSGAAFLGVETMAPNLKEKDTSARKLDPVTRTLLVTTLSGHANQINIGGTVHES